MTTVRVPCEACRRRKIKCDRKEPCNFCSKVGVQCRYAGSPNRPGLRAGYVQSLERRVAALEEEFLAFKLASLQGSTPASTASRKLSKSATALVPTPQSPLADTEPWLRDVELLQRVSSIWFDRYHEWIPILHRPSITALVEQVSVDKKTASGSLLLKALVAVLATRPELRDHGIERSCCDQLQKDIVDRCLPEVSCDALQALIILAIFALGEGSMAKYWSLVSLSRRVSMELGLHDLVVHYCTNYEKTSLLPPRMLRVPETDVDMEQRVRAYWTVHLLESAVSIGVSWNLFVSPPQVFGLSMCSDEEWIKSSGQIRLFTDLSIDPQSPFGILVKFVNTELWNVHKFHQELCELTCTAIYEQRKAVCLSVDSQLVDGLARYSLATSGASPNPHTTGASHVNHVLLCCVANIAIVTLFQRMITPPLADADLPVKPWIRAIDRCSTACDHITVVLRELSEETLEFSSPLLNPFVFIAARFYIVAARIQGTKVSNKAHFLIYALRCSATHWPLAARLGRVLDVAMDAQNSGTADECGLPVEFWDFAYCWQDIDHALVQWSTSQNLM